MLIVAHRWRTGWREHAPNGNLEDRA